MPQLNQKSWVELFTSINGRPPTSIEYKEALMKGEFLLDKATSSELHELSHDESEEKGSGRVLDVAPTYETNQTISPSIAEFEQAQPSTDYLSNKIEQQFEQTSKEGTQIYYSNPFGDNQQSKNDFTMNDFVQENSSGLQQFIKLLVIVGLLVGVSYGVYTLVTTSMFHTETKVDSIDGNYTGAYEGVSFKIIIQGDQLTVDANNGVIQGSFEGTIDAKKRQISFPLWGDVKVTGEFTIKNSDIYIKVDDDKEIILSKD